MGGQQSLIMARKLHLVKYITFITLKIWKYCGCSPAAAPQAALPAAAPPAALPAAALPAEVLQ